MSKEVIRKTKKENVLKPYRIKVLYAILFFMRNSEKLYGGDGGN